jgi:hypothetical protein
MIQRIQSIYLAFVAVISGGLIFLIDFSNKVSDAKMQILDLISGIDLLQKGIGISFFIIALLALISVFLYKSRNKQVVINSINIVINLILLGSMAYHLFKVSGEIIISEKGIKFLIPFISIILLVLANSGIKKDEKLVKSVDRLR